MKKIGLCVCYDTKNFGSQLQVLATDKQINRLGYQTEIIRYKKKMSLKFALQTIPRLFNPYFVKGKLSGIKKDRVMAQYPEIEKKVDIRNRRFEGFVEKYFQNLSRPFVGWTELKNRSANEYDAFLCGSDQLWLPGNLGSHFYTLEFASNEKAKIAYATSFGVSQIPWYQKNRTVAYLKRFQSLSTRELKGCQIIKALTGKDVQVVCDPTLLFDAQEWDKIIPAKQVVKEPYIFCYFLGTNSEHRAVARELGAKTGLKLVTCPFLDNFVEEDQQFGDIQMYDMDAEDFVNLIRNAEYVLTDSFHGSVFSILHHKKFVTFNRFNSGSNSRNSRIDSLCEILGLNERRYAGNIVKQLNQEIDYNAVEKKLSKLRTESICYLENALDKM
ncbi:polysaccharide pyruvyl transferase family protein [Eisenbergiella porci]|uniref:polysaccharide pyruvyl transferase family protein n=1 Tax=Eisenbergiella porci TaxID=2652274 RepID=UPI0022E6EE21|nr:polysaccharide pyruvyl transferase family protein [Eisenbergiella porci]